MFTIFLDIYKITILDDYGPLKTVILYLSKKIVKKFQKYIKFDLQTYFNTEIMLSSSNRLSELKKQR